MADFSLQGLGISAEEFLGSMFAPHEIVRLRVFSDIPNTDFTGQKLEVEQGKFSNILGTLHRHNSENRGAFFAVNYGGHTDAEITRINAQFAEIDNLPLEEQLAKVKEFPLPPSLIIKTRKSLHCYWLVKNADVGRFRHIQRQLIAHFGADPACVNESRVLRLPEFYHCKQEPLMVECIKFNPELRYTQEQLSEHLPPISKPPEEATAAKSSPATKAGIQGVQKGLVLIGRKCDFFKYCRRYAKSLPEPLWHGMITNVAVFEGGVEAIHSISKPHPDYTFEATQKKIETFYKSGTRPMTCQTLAERGFKCPRLDSCGGKCKSPAGLAFFAMDISEIRKWLEKTKTATNTLDNVVIARQFINDYAYNVDTGFAHALITSEMKTKFSFKASDLEPIIAFHKEIHKAFLETHQVKFDRVGDELPQWYEFTDKGKLRFMPSVLANYCVENEKVFYCGDNYYFYQNGVYVPKDDMAAQQRIRHYMSIDKHKTFAQISDAERQWRIEICKTVREINVNHYIMNFKNGLYYVHADELKEHNPDVLSTIQLNANYRTEVNCPVFLKYLDDVLPKTEHDLVQEMLGYIMIAVSKAQKAFLLVGKKDSGKSTMLYLINTLLGEDNYSSLTWQNLDERFTTFQLFGKLANVFADLPSQALRDTGNFKAITGEDCIMIESKHKNGFSYKPFCTLVFSCNKPPKNYNDRTDAFYGRLIFLRFANTIPVEKQDRGLKEKLLAEIDSIMAWSLIGLKRLMANNWVFSETERSDAEIKQYMTESSSVMMFVEEHCILDEKATCSREDLYNAFMEFNSSSKKSVSQIAFNSELEERYDVKRVSVSNRKSWRGIRLI